MQFITQELRVAKRDECKYYNNIVADMIQMLYKEMKE